MLKLDDSICFCETCKQEVLHYGFEHEGTKFLMCSECPSSLSIVIDLMNFLKQEKHNE